MPAFPPASTALESHAKCSRNWTRANHGTRIHRPWKNGFSDGAPPDRGQTSIDGVRYAQGGGGQAHGARRAGRIVAEGNRGPLRDGAGEPAVAAGFARRRDRT